MATRLSLKYDDDTSAVFHDSIVWIELIERNPTSVELVLYLEDGVDILYKTYESMELAKAGMQVILDM